MCFTKKTLLKIKQTAVRKCATRKMKSSIYWNSLWILFVEFKWHIVQQITGIPMGTNCLSNMPLYSHDTKIIQKQITSRYIDNLLSINNTNCANWIPLTYPQKKQHKQLLPTWNLTPMVNFLTDYMTEEMNSILQLYVFYTLILRYQ